MAEERARLSSTRVRTDLPAAQEIAALTGQSISGGSILLEDLLRRAHVSHKYAHCRNSVDQFAAYDVCCDQFMCSMISLSEQTWIQRVLAGGILCCRALESMGMGPSSELTAMEREAVEIEIKYAGFVKRQENELLQVEAQHKRKLSTDMDYHSIGTLSMEAREKLAKVCLLAACTCSLSCRCIAKFDDGTKQLARGGFSSDVALQVMPTDIGQASRIGGVNPADISNLLIHLEILKRKAGQGRKPPSIKQSRRALVAALTSEADAVAANEREAVHA